MGHFRDVLLTLITLATLALLVWIFAAGTADAQTTWMLNNTIGAEWRETDEVRIDPANGLKEDGTMLRLELNYDYNYYGRYARCSDLQEYNVDFLLEGPSDYSVEKHDWTGVDATKCDYKPNAITFSVRDDKTLFIDTHRVWTFTDGNNKLKVEIVLTEDRIKQGAGNVSVIFKEKSNRKPGPDKYPDFCEHRPINSEHLQNCRARWPHLVNDVPHELGEVANGPSEFELDEDTDVRSDDNLDVSAERETPETFALEQNYPNPFNPSTTIAFALDKTQYVLLSVYDLLGQEVRVLLDGVQPAGRYHVPFDAGNLASGTYVYVIQTEEQVVAKTMSLLK